MNKIKQKQILVERVAVTVVILSVWQLLTLFFPPIVLPGVDLVIKKIFELITTGDSWLTAALTARRLLVGLLAGIGIGATLGILFGTFQRMERIFMPIVRILQTVPPVCWVVLALVWFGFNDMPCIFIVVTSTLPTVTINLAQGVRQIDKKLIEMAQMYHFSRWQTFRHVILPSIMPYIYSALDIVISGGWKIAVMAEVLTTSTGIGGAINTARLNIEPETLIAWAVILVLLCYLTQWLLTAAFLRRK